MSHRELPPDLPSQPETGPEEGATDTLTHEELFELLLRTRKTLGRQAGWPDAVQNSALRLIRRPPERPVNEAWARTVVRNALRSERRSERTTKRGGRQRAVPLEDVELVDPSVDLLQDILRAEQRAWLAGAVTKLKPKERKVIAMVLRGLTSPEIAIALETTDNAVRALYRRGLEKLHALAEKERRTQ